MRRHGVILLTVAILAIIWVVPADAINPTKAAMLAGGNRLVAEQNADGGWFFTVGDADCGLGAGVSCANTFGVTALGLVDSWYLTRTASHRTAALRAGNHLLVVKQAAPPCDGNPATSADRPITADIFFLQQLTQMTGVRDYVDAAKDWFECIVQDFPIAADRADDRLNRRIGQGLNNLGAWDAALDIRAALAVGERAYALAEAKRIIAQQPVWDVDDPDCAGCNLLSKGLLLAALQPLRSDRTVRAAHDRWAHDLVGAQGPDGSWVGGDTQTTAYAVMGLATSPYGRLAVKKGKAFLLAQQQSDGGFIIATGSTTEITEVDSEALQALRDAHEPPTPQGSRAFRNSRNARASLAATRFPRENAPFLRRMLAPPEN